MQVREAVIPNQAEPVEHPTQGWEKLEKDIMVLSFHISPWACLNAIKCPLVAFVTMLMYLEWFEVKTFTFLCTLNAFMCPDRQYKKKTGWLVLCLSFYYVVVGGVLPGRWGWWCTDSPDAAVSDPHCQRPGTETKCHSTTDGNNETWQSQKLMLKWWD